MINIIIAGITGEVQKAADELDSKDIDGRALCNMLNIFFTNNLNNYERFARLLDRFGITIDNDLREGVKTMCNLGQGLLEKGETRGAKEKEAENIISFYMDGDSIERLARVMEESEAEIKQILADNGVKIN